MNTTFRLTRAVLAAGLLLMIPRFAAAQEGAAILEALVRKGVLSQAEAAEIQAEARASSAPAAAAAAPGGKSTTKLSVGGRLQLQHVAFDTSVDGASDPDAISHFFLRRVYLTTKASLGENWGATLTYDFAGESFDAAFVQWKGNDLTIDLGLRKVNVGYEERLSSGSLQAIERSGVTRYFAEDNNGRRLGATSYRVGLFVDGEVDQLSYGLALTNAERASDFDVASSVGDGGNDAPALWANLAYGGELTDGSWKLGAGAGYLPDQGGKASDAPFGVGTGHDLFVSSVFADFSIGRIGLAAEYLWADVEGGAAGGRKAKPNGFWIQPSVKLTSALEAVFRYSYLDSDGRGVSLSDGVRSAPSGGTMDKLTEVYAGGNWYLLGNDLKFQAGFVYGRTEDTVGGAPAEAESTGVRSQLQVNF